MRPPSWAPRVACLACGAGLGAATVASWSPDLSRYEPSFSFEDVPKDAPLPLASAMGGAHRERSSLQLPRAGAKPAETQPRVATFLRVRRKLASTTGKDLTVRNASGETVYTTHGLWDSHASTVLRKGGSLVGRKLARMSMILFSLRLTFEVYSYAPVCFKQKPLAEKDEDGSPLYSFARLTKWFFTLYAHYTLERYTCDGTLEEVFDISIRRWFLHKYLFNVSRAMSSEGHAKNAGAPALVGTIDQTYFWELTPNYDVWLAPGEDEAIFVILAVLIDTPWFTEGSFLM